MLTNFEITPYLLHVLNVTFSLLILFALFMAQDLIYKMFLYLFDGTTTTENQEPTATQLALSAKTEELKHSNDLRKRCFYNGIRRDYNLTEPAEHSSQNG